MYALKITFICLFFCLILEGVEQRPRDSKERIEIDLEHLSALIQNKIHFLLVDATSYPHTKKIPNSISLPQDIENSIIAQTLPDKKDLIIVYCEKKECSSHADLAKRLKELGYSNVKIYSGSLEEWESQGYPLISR